MYIWAISAPVTLPVFATVAEMDVDDASMAEYLNVVYDSPGSHSNHVSSCVGLSKAIDCCGGGALKHPFPRLQTRSQGHEGANSISVRTVTKGKTGRKVDPHRVVIPVPDQKALGIVRLSDMIRACTGTRRRWRTRQAWPLRDGEVQLIVVVGKRDW